MGNSERSLKAISALLNSEVKDLYAIFITEIDRSSLIFVWGNNTLSYFGFQSKEQETYQKWFLTFGPQSGKNRMLLKIERMYFSEIDILKCQWLMEAKFVLIDDSFLGRV